MYMSSGYYRSDFDKLVDTTTALRVNSAGHYRLLQAPSFRTTRTGGREDFHLLYLTRGVGHFYIGDTVHDLNAGEIMVYYPGERQEYEYFLPDNPDIFWLHFTGNQAEILLQKIGLYHSGVLPVGNRNRYLQLFEQIISELQVKNTHYLEIANSALHQLLLQFSRGARQREHLATAYDKRIERTLLQLHRQYNEPFSVEARAREEGVSTCWFIRSFKEQTGDTPLSYLTRIRIRRGQELLEDPELTVAQISELVGYNNPFYFSRQFRRIVGASPSGYRKNLLACPSE